MLYINDGGGGFSQKVTLCDGVEGGGGGVQKGTKLHDIIKVQIKLGVI